MIISLTLHLLGEYAMKIVEKRMIQAAPAGRHWFPDFFLAAGLILAHLSQKEVQKRANRVITERLMLLQMDHPGIATGLHTGTDVLLAARRQRCGQEVKSSQVCI